MAFSSVSVINLVPKDEAEGFFNNLLDGIDYEMISGAFIVDCTTVLPDVFFMVDNYWI